MNELLAHHRSAPWRVHTLAPDFELLDVWRFELGSPSARFDDFSAAFWAGLARGSESSLARLRLWLGKVLGWDAKDHTLPIPGCRETSLSERLSAGDRAATRSGPDAAPPVEGVAVKCVYRFENEALYEISNDTIHALIHISCMAPVGFLAVYIKSRGLMSRLYMAGITPFRHLVVYPALLRDVNSEWKKRAAR